MSNHLIKVFLVLVLNFIVASSAQRQVYIVYLGGHNGQKTLEEIKHSHHSYLHSVKGSFEEAKSSIVHSYTKAINGFSAFLTDEEANAISEMDGVISVFRDIPAQLHTSRSWDFISLLENDWNATRADGMNQIWSDANGGKDVIIGVIDTGIWPESESFDDTGMDPIPTSSQSLEHTGKDAILTSWKGICQSGQDFNASHCNRKLIGARYYRTGYEAQYGPLDPTLESISPRDKNGHGTHTASTVGGRRVANASAYGGLGEGTVTGGAPLGRLAIYKVCWTSSGICSQSDMLAGFDDAIADGVHVISGSIGLASAIPYDQDGIAIGALHAAKQNIVVSLSAGNSGPTAGSVTNVGPWSITVGASSIDRVFSSPLLLGSGEQAQGQSVTPIQVATHPLVYAGDVEISGSTTNETTGQCNYRTLSTNLTQGKAVLCLGSGAVPAYEVQRAGGVAAVLQNGYFGIGVPIKPYTIPATTVLANETQKIWNYINTTQAPTATFIPVRTLIGTKPAPFMALFSSRGPNAIDPNVLKPDITAPGLNILAAWSEGASPIGLPSVDPRVVKFNFDSGTSMACPHVSGVAALLKAIHPTWSSAAIRSAIITTAKVTDNSGNTIENQLLDSATPFEYGSGHIQPSKAADPGLIYNASYSDYLQFICSSIGKSLDSSFSCPDRPTSQINLNYPSLAIANVQGFMTIQRSVTNVGSRLSTYSVTISQPEGYSVTIFPSTLWLFSPGQTRSFMITVRARSSAVSNQYAFGSYTWSDGVHQVRSPIALSTISSITISPDDKLHASA